MARELTAKQEKFVQEYLTNGNNASAAYREAYDCSKSKPETIHRKASEVLRNGKVEARIAKHKQKIEKKFEYTVEQSFKNLELAQKLALDEMQIETEEGIKTKSKNELGNFIKAEELKGKLAGHYIDRSKNETTHHVPKGIKIEILE